MVVLITYFVVLAVVLFVNEGFMLEGGLDYCGLSVLSYCFCLDYISVCFLVMLFFCGVLSLSFSSHYSGGYNSSLSLFWGMVGFLFIMGCLVVSRSYILSLVMWEYLGIVSFLLILYYGNQTSLRATLVTLFASRFGDVSFFVLILWNIFWFSDISLLTVCLFICLIIFTKSACFPFISWLLEAMRAPTPVSSLVHSSTLVAAGVWFLFRYNGDLMFGSWISSVLLLVCLVSIFISSFCSIVFMDLKKIVALSTCNNISWCIVFFLLGDLWLGVVQLLTHGICKCFLFISLGDLMSCSGGGQDCRGMFVSRYSGVLGLCTQGVLVLSLCGVPFLGVFFSKHFLLGSVFFVSSVSCIILLFLCFFLSYVYSFRLLLMLWEMSGFNVSGVSVSFILVLFCSLFGGVCNYVMCFGLYESFSSSVLYVPYLFLFIQLVGCFLGVVIFYFGLPWVWFSFWGALLWGCEGVVFYFYKLMFGVLTVFSFVNYRWEVSLLSSVVLGGIGVSWLWLKVMVGSLLFMCALFSVFWG